MLTTNLEHSKSYVSTRAYFIALGAFTKYSIPQYSLEVGTHITIIIEEDVEAWRAQWLS